MYRWRSGKASMRPRSPSSLRAASPGNLDAKQQLVYLFCTELHRRRMPWPTNTWTAAVEAFGEQGVVDLIGVTGYYTFLSMLMNAAQTPAPASDAVPLPERR